MHVAHQDNLAIYQHSALGLTEPAHTGEPREAIEGKQAKHYLHRRHYPPVKRVVRSKILGQVRPRRRWWEEDQLQHGDYHYIEQDYRQEHFPAEAHELVVAESR